MATNNAVNTTLSGQTGTGQFVGSGSPTLTTPRIAQINDTNGNAALGLTASASAVNYPVFNNSATGNPVGLQPAGSDTNIQFNLASKGTSPVVLAAASTTVPFQIISGTGYQHTTSFSIANTAASRTVTLQDADGTLAYLSDITSSSVPVGSVIWYTVASNPTGYLTCNGAAVSRTTYAALFAVIGTTYGAGDGSTTFNLPNLARRTIIGEGGTGSGVIGNTVASVGGSETQAILFTNLPTSIPASNGVITTQSVATGVNTNVPGGAATWTNGSAVAPNNMQPSMVLRPLIKF